MASRSGWHRRRQDAAGRQARRRLVLERLCDRRVLASIAGGVFEDANLSYRQDADENVLHDRLVYLDLDEDGWLGADEPYRRTDADGTYAFDDLTPGDYVVRLFNGTQSQRQTVPVAPRVEGSIAISAATAFRSADGGDTLYALRPQAVARIEPLSGAVSELPLGSEASSLHPLPDGRLLVLGDSSDDPANPHAWLVSFEAGSVTPVDLGLADGETGWASAAIDASGQGVLIASGGESTALRRLAWTDGLLEVSATDSFVPAGTYTWTSAGANTSLIAMPGDEGLTLALWSNATAQSIQGTSVTIPDGVALLDFDDAAGLAVVRNEAGETLVYDVAAGFALLDRIPDLSEAVMLDGGRDLLFAINLTGDLLIRDLMDHRLLADVPVAALDTVAAAELALAAGGQVVLVGRGSDVARVHLDQASGHRRTLREGDAAADVMFGLAIEGTNAPPRFEDTLAFELAEDTALEIAAPAMLASATDLDVGDSYVLLQGTNPARGTATVGPTGSLHYQPNRDAFGVDQLDVVLHDGRSSSPPTPVQLTVTAVNDPLGPVTVDVPAVPEDTAPGTTIGSITISNPDPGEIVSLFSDDHRFEIHDNAIVFVGPELDYEVETSITFTILGIEEGSSEDVFVAEVQLEVADVNEPVVGVGPDTATVDENSPGAFIAQMQVADEDFTGVFVFSVDDDRFEFVDDQLQLVEGVALDFEAEPEVVVQVTVTDTSPGGNQVTEPLTITVGDVNEMPTTIWFEGDSVLERLAGAPVGQLMIDDPDRPQTAIFSVDDSRFEFAGNLLKLRDGVWVERAVQEQIALTLTASDDDFTMSIDVLIDVLGNEHPYQNPHLSADVDGDGKVDALDALLIINYINSNGVGPIVNSVNTSGNDSYVDVNGDGMVTPLDALLVINVLNQEIRPTSTVGGEDAAEGEAGEVEVAQAAPPLAPTQPERRRLHAAPVEPIALQAQQQKLADFQTLDNHAADAWMQRYAESALAPREEANGDFNADLLADDWQRPV